jgi:hypothetical protein
VMECHNCHHPVHLHRLNGDCTECATRCSHAAGLLLAQRMAAQPPAVTVNIQPRLGVSEAGLVISLESMRPSRARIFGTMDEDGM